MRRKNEAIAILKGSLAKRKGGRAAANTPPICRQTGFKGFAGRLDRWKTIKKRGASGGREPNLKKNLHNAKYS